MNCPNCNGTDEDITSIEYDGCTYFVCLSCKTAYNITYAPFEINEKILDVILYSEGI